MFQTHLFVRSVYSYQLFCIWLCGISSATLPIDPLLLNPSLSHFLFYPNFSTKISVLLGDVLHCFLEDFINNGFNLFKHVLGPSQLILKKKARTWSLHWRVQSKFDKKQQVKSSNRYRWYRRGRMMLTIQKMTELLGTAQTYIDTAGLGVFIYDSCYHSSLSLLKGFREEQSFLAVI